MKRFYLLIFAVFICSQAVNARLVKGIVFSSNDTTAVADATCRLVADGKDVAAAVTSADGSFVIDTDIRKSLNLIISKTGFSPTDIIIESGAKTINLGYIFIDEGLTLDEVTVTAQSVIHSKGRTIVYPSSADVQASSTAISLFQKLPLPGLAANPITRSISVDGGSPKILINGVPSTMEDVNALLPKDIEKVEFSRFVPARYADSGNTGFINITLKKRDDGGQVYAWGRSALTTAFVDANIRASYHQGPSQFTLSYNPSWRNYQQVYDYTTQSYIGDDFRVDLKEQDRNPFNYQTHNIGIKYDYSPTLKTLFSATFRINPSDSHRRAYGFSFDSVTGQYDYSTKQYSNDLTPSLDLFLRHDFNERNTLEAQVVGTINSSDYRRDNKYFNYTDEPGREEQYIMNVDSRRRSLISQINYIHSFSDKTSLTAGLQNTISHSTNTYLDSDYKPVLTENNNYAYLRLGQSAGNFYFSLATGAKLYWINNDANKRSFIRNLSSANISWNINDKWNIYGYFQYSPSIPSLSSLTDYRQQITPYLISNGNADLKAPETFSYSLGASFTYKKFSAALQTSFVDISHAIISDVTYLGNKLFLSQSVNARYSRTFSNYVVLSISDVYGFGGSLYVNVSHYQTAGPSWTRKLTSASGSLSLWWNKGPVTISYWRQLPAKTLSGQMVSKDENGDALQVEYKPNKHWTLGAAWFYMFDKKGTRYPYWNYSAVNPSERDRYIKNNSNMVVLSACYTADFGSIFRTARRNLNNTDNGSSLLKF